MWDVLRNRVLRTDISDPDIRSFTGFAQCIVARIEVLSFLELVLKQVFLGGHFTVETKQTLFIGAQGAGVHLVLLMRIHFQVLMNWMWASASQINQSIKKMETSIFDV
jgi:hypothetical protein